MTKEPRDLAIDILVAERQALLNSVRRIEEALKTLQSDPAADPRKFACSRCGVRFFREDLLADHTANVHGVDHHPLASSPSAVRALVEKVGLDGPVSKPEPGATLDLSDGYDGWEQTMKEAQQ